MQHLVEVYSNKNAIIKLSEKKSRTTIDLTDIMYIRHRLLYNILYVLYYSIIVLLYNIVYKIMYINT